MRNLVEHFREIIYCHVYLISRVHWFRYIICCHEQLGFTRSFSNEPMVVFMKNGLRVKMIHYLWNNYMFKLVALLNLSSWCLMMVERLFLAVPRSCLLFVIVVFPDHTHLLFLLYCIGNNNCQWDWSVIFRFESAFLKICTTFAFFQSRGTSPVDSDCWNILVKTGYFFSWGWGALAII